MRFYWLVIGWNMEIREKKKIYVNLLRYNTMSDLMCVCVLIPSPSPSAKDSTTTL